MSAYIIVEAVITDPVNFMGYARIVPSLLEKFGGKYIAIKTKTEVLEGDWGETKIVLHEWPSMDAARKFWNSDEYQQAKKLREGTGTFRVMLVDGINTETLE